MRSAATTTTTERAVMNVKETARYMGVSESLIWKMIRQKTLRPTRFGDRVLFHKNYLDQLLCEGR